MTRWISLLLLFLFSSISFAQNPIRGLRVDPSYFYELYPTLTAAEIAQKVISRAEDAHVNTLFVYAYASNHGAFYPTDYPLTEVETHFGEKNIFNELYQLALSKNFNVIAVISLTDYKSVWTARPDWRSKKISGEDYKPMDKTYLLSAWHPEYRQWLNGFLKDIVQRFPNLYAIEAVEPTVDCYWRGEADYNPAANSAFFSRFPNGSLGDDDWKKIRAQGITELLGMMSEISHAGNIKSGVVQTWPAQEDGGLFTSEKMRDVVGFDLNEILSLKDLQKIDFVVGEFLWQQWRAEYGTDVFTPAWTLPASQDFDKLVARRSDVIIHIEISTWHGQHSSVTPNLNEFQESLQVISKTVPHIDVYDYSQIENRSAWEELAVWK
ncbi:hypothetical protein B9G69_015020 [Bdellovibrio sp. SKB1291214]|uniref:hypothetical protein n=1 Tax=Bdellovibrio sp. SKB1291214 TaxID=1732569 RepID=UPI000B515086|nr:hypothetical protein [Bdellovibrio sp. SKB1291214]UYL08352.1 hypothetical protein B9G69_015020 [Bdellovibrio sp. SKB1291214]